MHTHMRKELHNLPISVAFLLMMIGLMACSQIEDVTDATSEEALVAVSFDTYLQKSPTTRATYPDNVGSITLDQLKETGFGVSACYSGNTPFVYSSSSDAYTPDDVFNFMYNQQVTWDISTLSWTYDPVKYWPNDNNPADDEGAIGSQDYSYVSFYAYAPWVAGTALPATPEPSDNGIIAITNNETNAGVSYLTYRTASSMKVSESVDLLWATQPNLYKTKTTGEGYVNGRVPFHFIHALSRFTVTVQGLFDHTDNGDTSTTYPDDVDDDTRILIESVEITSPTVYQEGRMYLAPRPDDATVPYWENLTNTGTLNFDDAVIQSSLLYTGNPADQTDAATAKADFEALPTGVTHTETSLFTSDNTYYTFPPTTDTPQPLTVRIVYYTITYDEHLLLNTPKYYSIVKNDVTYTSTQNITFDANKTYTLRLQPGLTTVKFEVKEVDEWGSRILLAAEVKDWKTETHEYDIDDSNTEPLP